MKYIEDTDLTLYNGDVREVLASLPEESVHCVVTSPPYWGLRDYGTGSWVGGDPYCDHTPRPAGGSAEKSTLAGTHNRGISEPGQTSCRCGARRVDNQLGLEATPELYLDSMVAVFREVRRVLRRDGTCWLNMGDSYAGGKSGRDDGVRIHQHDFKTGRRPRGDYKEYDAGPTIHHKPPPGLKPKDLCMIPARLALALQADGWWLRSQIVWSKPNPMPESVTDRPTTSHEFVFLLTRSPRYFYDAEAVREPHRDLAGGVERFGRVGSDGGYAGTEQPDSLTRTTFALKAGAREYNPAGRNVRSVWEIATQPYPEAHFATYPEELVRRCILAGSSERGCCPECGAPWTRKIETKRRYIVSEGGSHADGTYRVKYSDDPHETNFKPRGGDALSYNQARWHNEAKTVGWLKSCTHDLEPTSCTVLDPFFGSGTTGLVARKHGRRTIGIELNVSYCELAARRLQQLSLLA